MWEKGSFGTRNGREDHVPEGDGAFPNKQPQGASAWESGREVLQGRIMRPRFAQLDQFFVDGLLHLGNNKFRQGLPFPESLNAQGRNDYLKLTPRTMAHRRREGKGTRPEDLGFHFPSFPPSP
jgi:hypothetical protein